ncbi:hypothetical protein KIF59_18845 [Enterobacter cloacae subsp. cloacae]|nr:hypothetical protein [Enterobacter cloacae subsp. cloacae]
MAEGTVRVSPGCSKQRNGGTEFTSERAKVPYHLIMPGSVSGSVMVKKTRQRPAPAWGGLFQFDIYPSSASG